MPRGNNHSVKYLRITFVRMRHLTLMVLFVSAFQFVHAGDTIRIKNRYLSAIQWGVGFRTDYYSNMGFNQISGTVRNPKNLNRNVIGFSEDFGSKNQTIALYLSAAFSPSNKEVKGFFGRSEWQFGLGYHTPGELRVGYNSEALDSTIIFCNLGSEISFETAYLLNVPVDNGLTLFGGLGGNASFTRNNEVMVQEGPFLEEGIHPRFVIARPENTATYEAKRLIYLRPNIIAGAVFRYRKFTKIYVQYRIGIGAQIVPGHGVNFINRSTGLNLGVRYSLKYRIKDS